MERINYKGKNYPLRTFLVFGLHSEGEESEITIAPETLSEAMGEDKEKNDTPANNIDNEIYFYVLDKHFGLSASEICQKHLDEPIQLLEEL